MQSVPRALRTSCAGHAVWLAPPTHALFAAHGVHSPDLCDAATSPLTHRVHAVAPWVAKYPAGQISCAVPPAQACPSVHSRQVLPMSCE